MPQFSIGIWIVIGAAILVSVGGISWGIYTRGEDHVTSAVQDKQIKTLQKVKKTYDKIDHKTPYNGNDVAVAKFLLEYTRGN